MKIKEIYIRDFGIFQNEKIDNLNDKFVVIGGQNRAGKTTFMKLLRHLGFGFFKGADLPEAKVQYEAEFNIVDDSEKKYNIRLSGYKEPLITSLDDKEQLTGKELFKTIDFYTYSQLFNISLNELQRIKGKSDKKLQGVLLGAGLKHIAQIPEVASDFKKEAKKIGGEKGSPTTKLFKSYNSRIIEGIALRQEALKQVEQYEEKTLELNKIEENIQNCNWENLKLEDEINFLDMIKGNLSNIIKRRDIQLKLKQYNFNSKEIILALKHEIEAIEKKTFGIKEKKNNFINLRSNYIEEKEQCKGEMNRLNRGFQEDIMKVLNIDCDAIKEDSLNKLLLQYNAYDKERLQYNRLLEESVLEKDLLKNQMKELIGFDIDTFIKKYLYIALSFVFIGGITLIINRIIAAGIIFAGIVGGALYTFINYSMRANALLRAKENKIKIKNLEDKIKVLNSKLQQIESNLQDLEYELATFTASLHLNNTISYEGIKDYFKALQLLQRRIRSLLSLGKRVEREEEELQEEVAEIMNIVKKFTEEFQIIDGIKSLDEILSKFEIISEYLTLAQQLESIEEQILQGLNSNRIKETLTRIFKREIVEKKEKIYIIEEALREYTSNNELEEVYINKIKEHTNLKDKVENFKEQRQSLKDEIKRLDTVKKLENSQRQIDKSRKELRPLAEKYAVNSAAALILEKLQKRFIEKTKANLLGDASKLFNKITEGEYKEILPMEDILEGDFKTLLSDNTVQESVDDLSRGTGEQLFLSVRLSRIKEIEPKLPVIIDDSFVNFDSVHLKNTIKVLYEISKTNQIFLLTCHSKLIEYLEDQDIQFLKLDKGKFGKSNKEELINFLSK